MKPSSSPPAGADAALEEDRPSKTQLKKAMHELQELGEALLRLPDARLAAIPMPEPLLLALQQLRRTRSHEGRRRQLQYVGKLMRGVDAQPLREAVAAQQLGPARETLALHEAERWRDRLLESDDALTPWLAAHPQTDAQALRTLIRNARREAAAAPSAAADAGGPGATPRKGRYYRELFRALSEQLRAGDPPEDNDLQEESPS
jgi:ribosome-associated protein